MTVTRSERLQQLKQLDFEFQHALNFSALKIEKSSFVGKILRRFDIILPTY